MSCRVQYRVVEIEPEFHIETLTSREKEVALLMIMDHNVREIARKLGIAIRSASDHMSEVRRKTGLVRRSQPEVRRRLVELALKANHVELPEGCIVLKVCGN